MSTQQVTPEILAPQVQENQSVAKVPKGNPNWVKGMASPNPKGSSSSVTGELSRLLRTGRGRKQPAFRVAAKLLNHALEGRDSISLQATEIILDRTEGKAVNRTIEVHVEESTLKRFCDLAERLLK